MQSQVRPCLPVHPRLRGELGSTRDKMTGSIGSSPLTRGTRVQTRRSRQRYRFIPAYAGNSRVRRRLLQCCSVHPRLRGELSAGKSPQFASIGSSPLTRGTRENSSPHEFHGRFIPAYAGNSVLPAVCMRDRSVHPRLRGELFFYGLKHVWPCGSSPLTRGTHLKWLQHYTNRLTAKLLKNISKQEQSY